MPLRDGRYIAPSKIVKILRKYKENYQEDSIELSFNVRDDVLLKAMKKCRFPSDDHVIGMIDFGFFSAGGSCILFGEKGVYYNNSWIANRPGSGRVLFGVFPEREFKSPFYSTEVSLGCDGRIYPGCVDKKIIVDILNEIKAVIVSGLSKS